MVTLCHVENVVPAITRLIDHYNAKTIEYFTKYIFHICYVFWLELNTGVICIRYCQIEEHYESLSDRRTL